MIRIEMVFSELTNDLQPATICPELISEIDGKRICEGIADCDLLDMHEFGIDANGRIMPVELMQCDRESRKSPIVLESGSRRLGTWNQQQVIVAWTKRNNKRIKREERRKRFEENKTRIRANEHRWMKLPGQDEVDDIMENDDDFTTGIAKLMLKCIDRE